MSAPDNSFFKRTLLDIREGLHDAWVSLRKDGPGHVQFWFLALLIGIASGFVALGFRRGIAWLQTTLYQAENVRQIHSFAEMLPWYWIVLIPTCGGLVVGLILSRFTPDGRVRSVSDVIEGAALNDGRVEIREGLASALASLITLSSGGSSGREGPVVHLAATVSTWVSVKINANGITGRDLLGCAVAAGVSASFNAPIAGALFALEVVLRHFAIHAFAPIAIASVAGTVVSRLEFGNVTEYALPEEGALQFYVELPAFLLLGLVSGLVAVLLMKSIFWADDFASEVQRKTGLPRWLRPAGAGLLLGLLALPFPHIIGVGYETVSSALTREIGLWTAIVFCVIKVVAVAITMGGRMGGGVFSPSLMVGALMGLAFGYIATSVFPAVSGTEMIYALAGMGAVAAAVLGAPISTSMIIFELTGDWQAGLAVLVAVSLSSALAAKMVNRSFFLTQIERRNLHLAAGPQTYLLGMFRVRSVMRKLGEEGCPSLDALQKAISDNRSIAADDTLQVALPNFDRKGSGFFTVIHMANERCEEPEILGALFHVDALRTYNRALAATAEEEHG